MQVDRGPDNGNIWTCSKCGADAEMLTCVKRKVAMPASASCLVARSGFLYTEIGTPPYTTPRAYFAEHGTVGLVPVPVYLDEHGAYSAIIDGVQIKID